MPKLKAVILAHLHVNERTLQRRSFDDQQIKLLEHANQMAAYLVMKKELKYQQERQRVLREFEDTQRKHLEKRLAIQKAQQRVKEL